MVGKSQGGNAGRCLVPCKASMMVILMIRNHMLILIINIFIIDNPIHCVDIYLTRFLLYMIAIISCIYYIFGMY